MTIGIDASRANKEHKTGTEWYSYHLIKCLAKIDSKNNYILYTDKPLKGGLLDLTSDKFSYSEEEVYDDNGYQVIKSPFNNFRAKVLKWPFDFMWTQGRLSLEMLYNRPDVLFVPAHVLPIIHPKKSVVTIHDVGFKRDGHIYSRDAMGPIDSKTTRGAIDFLVRILTRGKFKANTKDYLDWSTQYALSHARKVITVSQFSKKEIIDIYGTEENKKNKLEEKVVAVLNGYNQLTFKHKNNDDKMEEILNKYCIESPFIFYTGRLDKKKNIPALIEAFAIMKEKNPEIKHRLVLTGPANYGYDEINYMIREFGLDNDVIITGWIPEEDLPYIFSAASLFVLPSLYEGFGIPLLQAMACHTPIVASSSGSIPEIVGDAALLFDPRKVYSIATAMEKVINNPGLGRDLVEKGIKIVSNFSWIKCAEETLKEIEKMND